MKNKRFCTSYKDFALVIGILIIAGILFSTLMLNNATGATPCSGSQQCEAAYAAVKNVTPATQAKIDSIRAAQQAKLNYMTDKLRAAANLEALIAKMSPNDKVKAGIRAGMNPGGTPDYFGLTPNYALSPLPPFVNITGVGANATAIATVNASLGGAITAITVTNGGSNYWMAPVVSITGGGGTNATATATVNATGSITGVTITNPGYGFTSAPIVSFIGGGGTNASANATISASGPVMGLTLLTTGSGFTSPIVNISGGGGTGAAGNTTGSVDKLTLLNGGANYTSVPNVTIAGTTTANGTNATATAAVGVSIALTANGSGYTAPTVNIIGTNTTAATAVATGPVNNVALTTNGSGYTMPVVGFTGTGTGAAAYVTGNVDGIKVKTSSSNYVTAPNVSISPAPAGGINAAANATGSITSITVTNAGTGYSYTPNITIMDSAGTGSGATASAAVALGKIQMIIITSAGSGYTAPVVNITDTTGTGAAATAYMNVSGFTITNPGSLYTSAPSVTLSGGGGSATANATINVTGIHLTAGGSNYTAAPSVTITDSAGTPAVAAAASATMNVTGITVTNVGAGYNATPTVSITDSGAGTGATATATLKVTSLNLTNAGSGYTSAPAVTISAPVSGTQATANATVNVSGIVLTNAGSGYATVPGVTITDSTGTGATAAVTSINRTITGITILNPGTNYSNNTGNPVVIISPPVFGNGLSGDGSGATAVANVDPANGTIANITVTAGGSGYGGIRKFVDSLSGIGSANLNDLGQYIPIAVPDTTTFTGSDYYEIALVRYTQKMHADLQPTTLQGYVQVETPANAGVSKHIALTYPGGAAIKNLAGVQVYAVDNPQYLGPMIVAQRNRPVRIKFDNYLPTGTNGSLFLPVDTTIPGAGPGPMYANGSATCDWGYNRGPGVGDTSCVYYTQNRATLQLIGGDAPWISAGLPNQWTVPKGENSVNGTLYSKGVSVQYVPDMWFDASGNVYNTQAAGRSNNPGQGSLTFYYPNQMGAREMIIQDRAYGITRLNVYAGESMPYILQDPVEQTLVNGGTIATAYGKNVAVAPGTIPDWNHTIPLVIQDKAFVPGPNQLAALDPTWKWTTSSNPQNGQLWFPHVYMTNQNPSPAVGYNDSNPMGRWDYSPWYIPLFVPGPYNMPVANPLAGTASYENAQNPGTPNPSFVTDAFVDTSVVNGVAYPYITVEPRAYRFRILNGANDREYNLMWFVAASNKSMWVNGNLSDPSAGEVKMVPAFFNASLGFPDYWQQTTPDGYKYEILDGRASGVPDPSAIGPSFIQIGNEAGLLPQPVSMYNVPVGWDYFTKNITYLNIMEKTLLMMPQERADVVVDFSQFAGKTVLLYNDLPNPPTTFDERTDYYTCSDADTAGAAARAVLVPTSRCDLTKVGGAPQIQPGYGPNSRTILQIRVNNTTPAPAYNLTNLTTALPAAYGASQPAPIVPESVYNAAYNTSVNDTWLVPAGPAVTFFNGGPLWNLSVWNGGTGYTCAGGAITCRITPGVSITGGGGSGATATASVVHGVASITLTNKGSGYLTAPTVTIDVPTTNGGIQATAEPYFYLGAVAGVTLTNGGSGYTTAPTMTFTGGSGTGATGTAVISRGVASIRVANGGSGYTTAPTVTIAPPPATAIGGVQATATATIKRGRVTAITVTNPGAGYTVAPAVSISAPTAAGRTRTARATATLGTGFVVAVNMTIGGSGYTPTSLPTVTFTGGGGRGAAATAVYGGTITSIVVTIPANVGTFAALHPGTNYYNPRGGFGYISVPNVTISPPDMAGGVQATATAVLTQPGMAGNLTITNGGNGYTSAPNVTVSGNGGTGSVVEAKGVVYYESDKGDNEQFDWSYGRQNGQIASDIPYSGAAAGTAIPYNYPDLPIQEQLNNFVPGTLIGSANDGTQLWRLDNMGALTHPHEFPWPVQIVSKDTLDGWFIPPEPNEEGWKTIVKASTADQIFVIMRPTKPTLPFALPNSTRLLQPVLPLNASFVDAQNALQTNTMQDYGWEYIWQETKMGYEENEFMRPIIFNP